MPSNKGPSSYWAQIKEIKIKLLEAFGVIVEERLSSQIYTDLNVASTPFCAGE